jgi:hypothetical protein
VRHILNIYIYTVYLWRAWAHGELVVSRPPPLGTWQLGPTRDPGLCTWFEPTHTHDGPSGLEPAVYNGCALGFGPRCRRQTILPPLSPHLHHPATMSSGGTPIVVHSPLHRSPGVPPMLPYTAGADRGHAAQMMHRCEGGATPHVIGVPMRCDTPCL